MLLTHVSLLFVNAFSASASARRIASSSAEDRFTPDPDDGSCCTGLSCSCLCRFAPWSFANPARASSVPVSRMATSCQELFQVRFSLYTQSNASLCDTVFSHVLLPGVFQSTALICVSAKCSFRVFAAGSSSGLSLSLFLSPLHDGVVSHLDAV